MKVTFDFFEELNYLKYDGEVLTPSKIAYDIVNLIPEEFWNQQDLKDKKFLDIYCKSSRFLIHIYNKLFDKLKQGEFNDKSDEYIKEWIITKQLYAFYPTEMLRALGIRAINGSLRNDLDNFKLANGNNYKTQFSNIKEQVKDMKFDVVVGNPPYNDDIYLDFVTLGHNISNKYSCWITPAKWQAKGGKQNDNFRKDIVPHISKIIYYPVTTEIFSIAEIDGINISLIDKLEHTNINIQNISKTVKYFNNTLNRDIQHCLNNILYNIASKCNINETKFSNKLIFGRSTFGMENYNSMIEMITDKGKYKIFTATTSNPKILQVYCNGVHKGADLADKYKLVVCHMMGYNLFYDNNGQSIGANRYTIYNTDELVAGNNMVLFASNSIDEVKSLKSYLETKFVRFITLCSLMSTKVNNIEFWRFVPDPGTFDHIFTDEELYKKYNLTEEEINIIESVIKERKPDKSTIELQKLLLI